MATRRWPLILPCEGFHLISMKAIQRSYLLKRIAASLVASLLVFALTGHCSEESPEEYMESIKKDPGDYAGHYSLQPSRTEHSVILQEDGTAISERDGRKQLGFVQRDTRMLRIYLEDRNRPTGIFLLSDYNPTDWRGMWNGAVRILRKQP